MSASYPLYPYYFHRAVAVGILILTLTGCQFLGRTSGTGERVETTANPCLVLALPQSGPYSPFAAKIRHGAAQAVKELAANGTSVRLENINTENADWLARLNALPPVCAVVGGPIQEDKYLAAKKAGALEKRAFFAFMPTLQSGDEGKAAWRFFPSQQDQINALIKFATDELNIRTYGAFYPDDNYGRRMTQLLEKDLQKMQIPLQKGSYNPKAPATWTASLKPLINPRPSSDGKTLVPQTMFEAVFLPDSWKNIDGITKSLLVNGEDRLVLLGTTLWEQGLAGKQIPRAERFSLAVFPGVWNKSKAPRSIASSGDFWTALGYDFVNFGARVGLAMKPAPAAVTALSQKAAPAIRAMAPMHWDDSGLASQQLYLFQITPSGVTALDKTKFRQTRTAVSERAALRMQGWGHIDPQTGEALPEREAASSIVESETPSPTYSEQEPPRAIANPQPHVVQSSEPRPEPAPAAARPADVVSPGQMSNVPRPSYKLSLPIKK